MIFYMEIVEDFHQASRCKDGIWLCNLKQNVIKIMETLNSSFSFRKTNLVMKKCIFGSL